MPPMRAGILSLALSMAIILGVVYVYMKHLQPGGPGSLPAQAVSVTAVQNDLLSIAQAERLYYAQNSSYASLSDLVASGALTMPQPGRFGYTYTLDTAGTGFTVTARYTGRPGDAPGTHFPTLTVDQDMQIRQVN